MSTSIVFIAIGLVFAFLFQHLKNGAIRKSASYKLYAVRDELICLVAEGKLEEKGRIFEYYYKRINMLLELAPNVGLDDSIEAFLYLKNSKNFEQSLKEANRRAEEMLGLVANESKEVSNVIAEFYAASKNMMLAHSSILRMAYLLIIKWHAPELIKNIIPNDTREVIRTVRFADREEARFRDAFHHQAA